MTADEAEVVQKFQAVCFLRPKEQQRKQSLIKFLTVEVFYGRVINGVKVSYKLLQL